MEESWVANMLEKIRSGAEAAGHTLGEWRSEEEGRFFASCDRCAGRVDLHISEGRVSLIGEMH